MSREVDVAHLQKRRSKRTLPRVVIAAGALLCVIGLLVGVIGYYTTTDDFQRRVRAEIVQVLDNATGGRTELSHVSIDPWKLSIEVRGLTIHGTEPANEMPYLSVDRIVLRIGLNHLFQRARAGASVQKVRLKYLRVERPRFHLIIDKNGNTNQPKPKTPTQSKEPLQDVLLDLRAKQVEMLQGLVVINDSVVPFNFSGSDLNTTVNYVARPDRYAIGLSINDLRTQLMAEPMVQSSLDLSTELGRDILQLKELTWTTGPDSRISVHGALRDFSQPKWQFSANGSVMLREVGHLAAIDGLDTGVARLSAQGHSCEEERIVSTSPPQSKHVAGVAPSGCTGYLIAGDVQLSDASYRNEYVRLNHINGRGKLRVSPNLILFPTLAARLRDGGEAEGALRLDTVAGDTSARAHLVAQVKQIPLRTIMDITAPENYGDLGFDTSITGPVTVDWGGPAKDVSSSVQVEANLALRPTGGGRKGAPSNVPINGTIIGQYDGRAEVVNVSQVKLQTPATTLSTHGVLGVNLGDRLTNLQADLQTRDLGEFDQLLQTLGLESNGKRGTAAIPVTLHGTMAFTGSAKGEVRNLDVKGHLEADDAEVKLGQAADVQVDSVVADAEYSPNSGIAVASSTIRRGSAVLNTSGTFRPRQVPVGRRGAEYVWDNQGGIDATAKLAHAQISDLLQIAGQSGKVPVTGTADLNVRAKGTLQSLHATGDVVLSNGVAYGEAYQLLSVDAALQDQQINATKVVLRAHDEVISGSGGYNLQTKHIDAKLAGKQIQLSRFTRFNQLSPNTDGVLDFDASMNGTAEAPNLNAKVNLTRVTALGKPLGDLSGTATSNGSAVNYQVSSTLVGAKLAATGQTELTGDYQTQAKLTMSGLNLATALALFAPSSIKSSSEIAGTVTVNGPLTKPEQMSGNAEFQNLDLKLEGIELRSPEPLRASLRGGTVTLDQVHITGQDTDLRASGTAQVLGDSNPLGGELHLNANGNISMALAHSFDPDVISSGKVTFKMAAVGRVKKPQLTGDVKVQNVNLAIDGIANGLSSMNGTLVFDQNRLDVKEMTATSGGGQIKIGGYLGYDKGLSADLTASGDAVRVRMYGLSSTATANLRLHGTPDSMVLSGNVLVTRFDIGPSVDYAAFSAAGPSLPPPPDAQTNKIHMEVHVTSSPQLDFQNSYAKLAGSVDLTVRGTVGQPTILGRILVTEGKATFAGTTYELERGSITFSNPVRIDPVIDLDAAARVENYDVTIGLHGTMTSLHPTYRSSPPLTEADIFNLLALGRTQEEAQIYQQQQTQQGADPTTDALLGGALNATVASRVGKLFGNGSVKIDPTYVGNLGGSSARITIVEPISKQLTLTFATNVNETEEQLIQLQYQIDQNNAIVVTRDENDVYSVVYKIRRRYR